MKMNPLTMIPALYRKNIYLGYATMGVILGAVHAALLALPDMASPDWLVASWAVYGYLGVALGFTAGSNVDEKDTPPPAPEPVPQHRRED